MKHLSTPAMLEVFLATPNIAENAADKLCGLSPLLFDIRQLKRLTAEGYLLAHIISVENVHTYCVWTSQTADGGLHVNAAVQLTDKGNFDVLVNAIESLAKSRNCQYLRFNSRRSGLLKQSLKRGYVADSISMVKKLEYT